MQIDHHRTEDMRLWRERKRAVAARHMQPPAGIPRTLKAGQTVRVASGRTLGKIIRVEQGRVLVKWPNSTSWANLTSIVPS